MKAAEQIERELGKPLSKLTRDEAVSVLASVLATLDRVLATAEAQRHQRANPTRIPFLKDHL